MEHAEAHEEVVEETAEVVEETTEEVEAKEESEATTDNTDDTAADEAEDSENGGKQRKSGVQKRIDKLTADKYEAQRKAELAEEKLKKLLEADSSDDVSGKPNADDYDTYDEYLEKLVDWRAGKAAEKSERHEKLKEQAESEADREVTLNGIAANLQQAGMAKHDDFMATVQATPINDDMLMVIGDSEVGADIAYYLGKNPDQAAHIASLSPVQMGRAIAIIEQEVSRSAPAQVQKPAATVEKVKGSAKPDTDPENLPIDEWMRLRNEGKI